MYLFVQQEASSVILYMNFRKTCQIQRYVQELVVLYKCCLMNPVGSVPPERTCRAQIIQFSFGLTFYFDGFVPNEADS